MQRILLLASLGLSFITFFYLVLLQSFGRKLSNMALNVFLFSLLALSFFSAYSFDWQTNSNNDLSRWLIDVQKIKIHGFDTFLIYSDNLSILWRCVLWWVSLLEDYHWFAGISILIETVLYFYIIKDIYKEKGLSALEVILCIVVKFAFVPLAMSATGFRGTIAMMFFSLGIYQYSKETKVTIRTIIPMIIGLLLHTEIVIAITVFIISVIVKDKKPIVNLLLVFWPLLLGVITIVLRKLNLAYVVFMLNSLESYSSNANNYDHFKVRCYIVPILILMGIIYYWRYLKFKNKTRSSIPYIVTVLPIIVGSYFVADIIFLRLTYSIGFLFPLILIELHTKNTSSRKLSIQNAALLLDVILLAGLTQGCWIIQSYLLFWT